jgi:hypothetical protein
MPQTTKTGFGLLLFCIVDKQPKMAIIEELRDKPLIHKKAGMKSFPLETVDEHCDKNPEDTIRRLLGEELGLDFKNVIFEITEKEFHLIPNQRNITTRYAFGFVKGKELPTIEPQDTDITFFDWMSIEELLSQEMLRLEVAPIIHHFKESGLYLQNLEKMTLLQ